MARSGKDAAADRMAADRVGVAAGSAAVPGLQREGQRRAGRGSLQISTFNCDTLAEAQPRALGVTYWFDVPGQGEPYSTTIRFVGRRMDVRGKPGPADEFTVKETLDGLPAGIGPVALTTRAVGLAEGDWRVSASPTGDFRAPARSVRGSGSRPRLPSTSATGTTSFAPVMKVKAPGVTLGAWPALVALGLLAALTLQAWLGHRSALPIGTMLAVSIVASLVGVAGAKVYYLVTHRHEASSILTVGMCIQGFVLAAITTVVVGAVAKGIPVGAFLDVTAPALLVGMAIGRVGCFFGGCCAGRPTASSWGLWSSNRRVGVRRIPVQLLESSLALGLALLGVAILVTWTPDPDGVVFVGLLATYTLGRQLLFPLRDLRRQTARGRLATMWAAGIVTCLAVVLALLNR